MHEIKKGFVSVIIPCYNCENTIAETLDSVLSQTYSKWEALCCDDGSSDCTSLIVEEYSNKDSRIHYFKRTSAQHGGSVCRNLGLSYAQGEYCIFLDADDLLIPSCLERRVSYISKTNDTFHVFPFAYYKDGIVLKEGVDKSIHDYLYAFAAGHAVWQTSCPIYKTSFVRTIGGFQDDYQRLQDIEFGLRALCYSNNQYKIHFNYIGADCYYRTSQGSNAKQKYQLALSHYDKLANLVVQLDMNGKFSKKAKLKAVYICLLLAACQVQLLIERKKIRVGDLFPTSNLEISAGIKGQLVVSTCNNLSFSEKFQDLFLKGLRRILMWLFF